MPQLGDCRISENGRRGGEEYMVNRRYGHHGRGSRSCRQCCQFYFPNNDEFKYQDRINRQGRGKIMDEQHLGSAREILTEIFEKQLSLVKDLRERSVPEEYVRRVKGVGFYTKTWRTGDTHNLMHFLRLRDHSHAQHEVREYARQVAEAVSIHTPVAYEAFENYRKNSTAFSHNEMKLLINLANNGLLTGDLDLDNLDIYKGAGFVIKDKEDPTGTKKMLGREGTDFKKKLERLLGR